MSIFIVTGKLGSGKTLACVGRIRDALREGRRVATNLDLRVEHLGLARSDRSASILRVSDKPSLADLEGIGVGNDSRDESRNGLIVLDELGSWLNTRSWNDKERQPVIDWLLHSRKHGWDVYFIVQNVTMIDKQVRDGLCEFLVTCRRTDRLRIPLVTAAFKGWGLNVRPPQVHVATVRYGVDPQALVTDRWWYRGHELYPAYDTRQVFTDRQVGLVTVLPPYYLTRGSGVQQKGFWERLRARMGASAQRSRPERPKLPWVDRLMALPVESRIRVWHEVSQAEPAIGG